MKRLSLLTGLASLAALSLPGSASAEPTVLVIPTEAVEITNTGMCSVPQNNNLSNSALGCFNAASGTREPYDDVPGMTTAFETALADFDVHVTNERPPEYLPYMMLMPSTVAPEEESQSFTCTFAGFNCDAFQRNRMAFTSGDTEQCTDPDPVHAALYAFGRMSGLEGVDNIEDPMNYPPDYTMPVTGYQDACNERVPDFAFDRDSGKTVSQPLHCTFRQHVACDPPDGAFDDAPQNSYQDLLAFYGERLDDTTAPTFENVLPEDGTVLMVGELILAADILDDDLYLGARWTISSPALEEAGIEGGSISKCTNQACLDPQSGDALEWADGQLKATDSDWGATEFADAPAGEYTITLEASDFHGNVAEMITFTVTVMAEEVDDTGGADETGNGDAGDDGDDGGDDGVFTTGVFTADSDAIITKGLIAILIRSFS
ncbi:MAG: hypothetical protein JKY37_13315, partial [Nannocystaceae bacterium]|nr:hypothetical protein [Nannocystaceae bacterium]